MLYLETVCEIRPHLALQCRDLDPPSWHKELTQNTASPMIHVFHAETTRSSGSGIIPFLSPTDHLGPEASHLRLPDGFNMAMGRSKSCYPGVP